MEDLEAARARWIVERPLYEAFCASLITRLRPAVMATGIPCEISGRVKQVDSLVKKLLLKPEKTYESLGDKVGVRIITKYLDDIPALLKAARAVLDCSAADDTTRRLGNERMGYRGYHVDVRLPATENDGSLALVAELQIRTLGQHVWSEMAHDTVYKGAERLPEELKRRIYLQAALLEVADQEFSRVNREVAQAPGMEFAATLNALSRQYYELTQVPFDYELSMITMPDILSLYAGPEDLLEKVGAYVDAHRAEFESVFREQGALPEKRSIYLFQPEYLAIIERLKNSSRKTLRLFSDRHGLQEIERAAVAFGLSLD